MFKQFFEDNKDAMHYAKVMSVLLMEFGVHRDYVESDTSTIDVVKNCGELRRQGHNVESTALALVIQLMALRLAFPYETKPLPSHGGEWIRKALEWSKAGKVSVELMRILVRLSLRDKENELEQDPKKKALRIMDSSETTLSEMEEIKALVFFSPRAKPL
jgi:hypothetical protein